jgi:LytS/YehU family sensor histidine kinase
VDPLLPPDLLLPRLLTQPLIENAVKHGVRGLDDSGRISIQWVKEGRDVVFLLEDNGGGFDAAGQFDGQGLRLTWNRLALFNRLNNPRHITLRFLAADRGSRCRIDFKNWLPA